MENENIIEKAALIPDFFREFISRIVPGVALIGLFIFWSGRSFKEFFSDVTVSFFILIAAWIIGATLDIGIFSIVYFCGHRNKDFWNRMLVYQSGFSL
jgi:hypothetical protein